MWLSEETGPRRTDRGWAGISLQPAHAAASGEDVGTCAAVWKTDGGTLAAQEWPRPEGRDAISSNTPAPHWDTGAPSSSLLFNLVAKH